MGEGEKGRQLLVAKHVEDENEEENGRKSYINKRIWEQDNIFLKKVTEEWKWKGKQMI